MDRLPSLRVGAVERDRAVEALSEHMAAERLTTDEFTTRMELAHVASSEADLRALFEDLPAPHWNDHGSTAPAGRVARVGRKAAVVANALYPASGALAVALSAATGAWEWLLVVPPVCYGIRKATRKPWSDEYVDESVPRTAPDTKGLGSGSR